MVQFRVTHAEREEKLLTFNAANIISRSFSTILKATWLLEDRLNFFKDAHYMIKTFEICRIVAKLLLLGFI